MVDIATVHREAGYLKELAQSYLTKLEKQRLGIAPPEAIQIAVTNPSDGSVIGSIPETDAEGVRNAVTSAQQVFSKWRALPPRERSDVIIKWRDLMLDDMEALSALMTLEQGKPLNDSRGEVAYSAGYMTWFAEEASRLYGDTIPSHLPGNTTTVTQQPIGIVAAITPWNFPSAMLVRKAAAALAAGCPVIAVPSKVTPFSAIALEEIAGRAGLPKGLFQVLTGESRFLVNELCKYEAIRGVSYTGSTQVGRSIMAQCAPMIKRISLELGGHAPFIVFEDADFDKAVEGAIAAKFQTGGQDCLAANRIYVHSSIYDVFVDTFTKAAKELKFGDGFEEGTYFGPLATKETLDKSQKHVADAVNKGARLMCGGKQPEQGGLYFEPTVLADVSYEMKITSEETFGPVAAIIPFDDENEVIQQANDTEYGLVAYIYTSSLARTQYLPAKLEYGMVAINTPKLTGAPIPFGGVKQSGIGREGSRLGIQEFTEPQYTCVQF